MKSSLSKIPAFALLCPFDLEKQFKFYIQLAVCSAHWAGIPVDVPQELSSWETPFQTQHLGDLN